MKDLIKAISVASTMLLLPAQSIRLNKHQEGEVPDPGCHNWNFETETCDQCSWRWVKVDDQCVAVSDQCQTWGEQAQCTSCYGGNHLVEGECVLNSVDPQCKKWEGGECAQCYHYWWLNEDGECEQVSSQCKGYDKKTGWCKGCYPGWTLNKDTGECES